MFTNRSACIVAVFIALTACALAQSGDKKPQYPAYPSEMPDHLQPSTAGFDCERREVMVPNTALHDHIGRIVIPIERRPQVRADHVRCKLVGAIGRARQQTRRAFRSVRHKDHHVQFHALAQPQNPTLVGQLIPGTPSTGW
jgi:hypothetical protein